MSVGDNSVTYPTSYEGCCSARSAPWASFLPGHQQGLIAPTGTTAGGREGLDLGVLSIYAWIKI